MNFTDIVMMVILAVAGDIGTCLVFHDVSAGHLMAMLVILLYIAFWVHGVDRSLTRIANLLSGEEEVRPGLKGIVSQLQSVLQDIIAEENEA